MMQSRFAPRILEPRAECAFRLFPALLLLFGYFSRRALASPTLSHFRIGQCVKGEIGSTFSQLQGWTLTPLSYATLSSQVYRHDTPLRQQAPHDPTASTNIAISAHVAAPASAFGTSDGTRNRLGYSDGTA